MSGVALIIDKKRDNIKGRNMNIKIESKKVIINFHHLLNENIKITMEKSLNPNLILLFFSISLDFFLKKQQI